MCVFKKRVSIRDDDEIFRGGQTSTKKKRIFLGAAASSSFLSSSTSQSIFITRFVVANENKSKRDFDGERG